SRRRHAVDVAVVDDEVEGLDGGILRIAAMDGLATVTDDDVLHLAPDDVVEDGHQTEGDEVGEGREDGADGDERHAGGAVEVFLEVELVVTAGGAVVDQRVGGRGGDLVWRVASLTRMSRFAGIAPETNLAVRAEEVDRGHGAIV